MSAGHLTPERRELLELIKDACPDGRAFALRFDSIKALWESCDRPDWLIWMGTRAPRPVTEETIRAFIRKWMVRSEVVYGVCTSMVDNDAVMEVRTVIETYLDGSIELRCLLMRLDGLPDRVRDAVGRSYDPSMWRQMAREFRWGVGNPFELPDPPAALMHTGPIS